VNKLSDLIKLAEKLPKQRLVVVSAEDVPVIEAVVEAVKSGIVSPILLGDEKKIKKILSDLDLSLSCFKIINCDNAIEAAKLAVKMIKDKEADFIMKGLIDTKILLKEVVNSENGIKEFKLLSHASLMSYPMLDRLLIITDCAMNIEPNIEDKIAIIENVIGLSKVLNYSKPLVGIVSAVEKVNPKIKSTVDAVEIIKHFNEKDNDDFIIDGPYAIDNLVSLDASLHKGINSLVAGRADILLFPELVSGNVFYKTSIFLAGATAASIVIGAKCPIVLTSRADSSKAKYYSILLGMIYSYEKNNISN
jgi:phosphate butyryltransferase